MVWNKCIKLHGNGCTSFYNHRVDVRTLSLHTLLVWLGWEVYRLQHPPTLRSPRKMDADTMGHLQSLHRLLVFLQSTQRVQKILLTNYSSQKITYNVLFTQKGIAKAHERQFYHHDSKEVLAGKLRALSDCTVALRWNLVTVRILLPASRSTCINKSNSVRKHNVHKIHCHFRRWTKVWRTTLTIAIMVPIDSCGLLATL